MNKSQLNTIITNLQTYVDDKLDKLPVSYEEKMLITVPKESIDKSKADAATNKSQYIIQIPKDNGFEYTEGIFNNADLIAEYNGKKYICQSSMNEDEILCVISSENNILEFRIPINESSRTMLYIYKLDTTNITDIKLYMRRRDITINDLTIDNSISIGRTGYIGINSSAIGYDVIASGEFSHAEGADNIASGNMSHAEGGNCKASKSCSHAEGIGSTASGYASHAEGYNSTASGSHSHAEGYMNTAAGDHSHVEGCSSAAPGQASHAEGNNTTSEGSFSHAEGNNTTASGQASHAEGNITTASGDASHAEGESTIASGQNQHVQGRYNIKDAANKYAHIVGNGTANDNKSNAHTLDWNGNGWYAGKLSQEGTPTDAKDLVTKKYFDEHKDSYTLAFKENGNLLVTIGDVTKEFAPAGSGGSTISYIVQYNLTDCTSSNTATAINHGDSYTTTLSVSDPHTIQSVTIIMGGIDITSTAYNPDTKTITINTVTGNISITASAAAPTVGQINSDSKEISLSNLPAGTYTLKYESDDGVIDGFDSIGNVEVN